MPLVARVPRVGHHCLKDYKRNPVKILRQAMALIVVDSYSKWLEVIPVRLTDSNGAISALRTLFAMHGLPKVIVSDNATGFESNFLTKLKHGAVG